MGCISQGEEESEKIDRNLCIKQGVEVTNCSLRLIEVLRAGTESCLPIKKKILKANAREQDLMFGLRFDREAEKPIKFIGYNRLHLPSEPTEK